MGAGLTRIMTPLEPMHTPRVTCEELRPVLRPATPLSARLSTPIPVTTDAITTAGSPSVAGVSTPTSMRLTVELPMRPLSVLSNESTSDAMVSLMRETKRIEREREEEARKQLSTEERDEAERQEEGQPPARRFHPFSWSEYPLYRLAFRYLNALMYLGAVLHVLDILPVAARIWRYSASHRGVHQAIVDVMLALGLCVMYTISIVSWLAIFFMVRNGEIKRLEDALNEARTRISQRALNLLSVVVALGLSAAAIGQGALFIYALYVRGGRCEGMEEWGSEESFMFWLLLLLGSWDHGGVELGVCRWGCGSRGLTPRDGRGGWVVCGWGRR